MEWLQTLSTIVATAIMFGAAFKFMWSRLDKKFGEMLTELKDIKSDIRNLDQRVARLETQDEERFRNEVKLLIKERHIQ